MKYLNDIKNKIKFEDKIQKYLYERLDKSLTLITDIFEMPIEIQDKIHFYRDSPMGINIKCFNYLTNNTNFDTYISSEKEFKTCINIINKFKMLPGTCSETITYIQENKCLVIGFTKESQIIHYITIKNNDYIEFNQISLASFIKNFENKTFLNMKKYKDKLNKFLKLTTLIDQYF